MSRKRLFSLILCLTCVLCIETYAQNMDKMQDSYNRFIQMNASGAEKGADYYAALYQCYSEIVNVINASSFNSSARSKSIELIKVILPVLPNGAYFYEKKGDKPKAAVFASAYADGASISGLGPQFISSPKFKQMAYYAGAVYFSGKNYEKAVKYINLFLYTGKLDEKYASYRPNTDLCLADALAKTGKTEAAISVYDEATRLFPTNFLAASTAISYCVEINDKTNLQKFLNRAMAIEPGNKKLLLIQGQLYEDRHEYDRAYGIFSQLYNTNPNDATVVQHLSLNQYNMGVLKYNSYLLAEDPAKKVSDKEASVRYFQDAIGSLRAVLDYDPMSVKYTQALAVAYNCTGNKKGLDETNRKLVSLGSERVTDDYVPVIISEGRSEETSVETSVANNKTQTNDIPPYSSFAKDYITTVITQWQQKDPYENISEYQQRVNEVTRRDMIVKTNKKAEQEYFNRYAPVLNIRDLSLKPYDAENGAFLIDSPYGNMVLAVPRENNEARIFESSWNGIEIKDAAFCINSDKIAIRSLTFATPFGKNYKYDNTTAVDYTEVQLDVNFSAIDESLLASKAGTTEVNNNIGVRVVTAGQSDVDINIPVKGTEDKKKFAVIIANEDYASVSKVPMAIHDGEIFADYCVKSLGIPRTNVRTHTNASFGNMLSAMRDIKDISTAYNGDIDIVFYYAGHGIPSESGKEAYLLPIDADGRQTEGCYPLERLYAELEQLHAHQTVVFLDACFSGSKRGDGMLASARGVALKVKKGEPRGNVVVFSAASDDETAYPFTDKQHGLFTYYLLKKLQESKGSATLGELSDYVTREVRQSSIVINKKSQTPVITPSMASSDWRNWKL